MEHSLQTSLVTYPLIGRVRAVRIPVATPPIRHALAIVALELRARAHRRRTVQLVAAILAIIVAVAAPTLLDAFAIVAGELIGATRLVAVRLVGAVRTVAGVVAHPRQRNALAIVALARELLGGADFRACDVFVCVCFINNLSRLFIRTKGALTAHHLVLVGLVAAIEFLVALPGFHDALAVFAAKSIACTCRLCARVWC